MSRAANYERMKDTELFKLGRRISEIIDSSDFKCGLGSTQLMNQVNIKEYEKFLRDAPDVITDSGAENFQGKYNKFVQNFNLPNPTGLEDIRVIGASAKDATIISIANKFTLIAQQKLYGNLEITEPVSKSDRSRFLKIYKMTSEKDRANLLKNDNYSAGRKEYQNWKTKIISEEGLELPAGVKFEQGVNGLKKLNLNNHNHYVTACYLKKKYKREELANSLLYLVSTKAKEKEVYLSRNIIEEVKWFSTGNIMLITGCRLTKDKLILSLSMSLGSTYVLSPTQASIPSPGSSNSSTASMVWMSIMREVEEFAKRASSLDDWTYVLKLCSSALRFYNPRQCATLVNWGKRPGDVIIGHAPAKWTFNLADRSLSTEPTGKSVTFSSGIAEYRVTEGSVEEA